MGWDGLPLTDSGDTILNWHLLFKLYLGIRARFRALGAYWFPPVNQSWDTGTVSGASRGDGNSITLTMPTTGAWGINPSGNCSEFRWVNYICEVCALGFLPSVYDVVIVIDEDDPRSQMRGRITAQVNGASEGDQGTLTIDGTSILNAITAGYIDSIDQLEGKTYNIIASRHLWWADRVPSRPDDDQEWIGSATGGTGYWPGDDTTNPTTGVVTHNGPQYVTLADPDPKTHWTEDEWAGLQVMVYNAGLLKRLTIAHNDEHTLYITQSADSTGAGGKYSIIQVGKKCSPGRKGWYPWQWYTGSANNEVGHTVYDTLAGFPTPARNYKYSSGNPCNINGECDDDFQAPIFDIDYQVAEDELCSTGQSGDFINPDLYLSFRQLQKVLMGLAPAFVPDDAGEDGNPPAAYTLASWFSDIGLPSGSSSTAWYSTGSDTNGNPTGYYYFSVGGDFVGKPVYWSITNKDQTNGPSGVSTPGSDGVIHTGQGGSPPDSGSDPQAGLTVTYSLPWTRARPKWFKYQYAKTSFLPDIGSLTPDGEPQIIDPPAVFVDPDSDTGNYTSLAGTWMTKGASTGNVVVTEDGYIYDSAEPFVVGGLYRCIGDNPRDAFPGGSLEPPAGLIVPYQDKFYRGMLSSTNQSGLDGARTGKVSSGNYFSLTQTDHNWWSDWANGGQSLRTESGAASSGSATTLNDNTKNTVAPTQPYGSWWSTDRFETGDGAFVGFILEVDQTRTLPADAATLATTPTANVQQTVTFKVPITATTQGSGGISITFTAFQIPKYVPSTQTWTWESFTVAHNNAYRIAEPKYELNRYKGRKVHITRTASTDPDGNPIAAVDLTLEVQYSDRDTLYFATQSAPIEKGCKFQILERQMGVYRWNGSEMIATGSDPESNADTTRFSVSSPNDFLPDPNCNNEDWVKDYGLYRRWDAVTPSIINQMVTGCRLLHNTAGDYGWVSRADPNTPENNFGYLGEFDQTDGPVYYASDDDMQLAHDVYPFPAIDSSRVYSDDKWNKNYSNPDFFKPGYDQSRPPGEGQREAFFDYGPGDETNGGGPILSEAAGPPQRRFSMAGFIYGYHGIDPSGNYANQPYMVVEVGDFRLGDAAAGYCYGKATGIPTLLPCTVDMLVYCTIDPDDHDEGSAVVDGSDPRFPHNYAYADQTYTFDAGNTGATYRQWTTYATVAVDDDGTALGPKFGESDTFDSLRGHFEGCPDSCQLDSQWPTEFKPPEGSESIIHNMDRAGGSSYYFSKIEYRGFVAAKTAMILKWDMGEWA